MLIFSGVAFIEGMRDFLNRSMPLDYMLENLKENRYMNYKIIVAFNLLIKARPVRLSLWKKILIL